MPTCLTYFVPVRIVPQKHTIQNTWKTYVSKEARVCVGSAQAVITTTAFYFHTLTSPLLDHNHGRYNPDTDSWSTDVAPLSSPRSGVCLVPMDGYLYAIGGHDGIAATNTVERYCSVSGTKDQYLTLTVTPLNTYCNQMRLQAFKILIGMPIYYFPNEFPQSSIPSTIWCNRKALVYFDDTKTNLPLKMNIEWKWNE